VATLSSTTKTTKDDDYVSSPLVQFQSAILRYPPSSSSASLSSSILGPFDLTLWSNVESKSVSRTFSSPGGHVALGRNGSGKTLLSHALANAASQIDVIDNNDTDNTNTYLQSGKLIMQRTTATQPTTTLRDHRFLSGVSFESHSDLLLDEGTTTVYRALIPGGGNRLSDTAKFLTVRLGMFPLLNRFVNTLSTGQIRRVLLVRALVRKPELLVLDNAFDGLDVEGRTGLRDIIERVLRGFRMDILVQGVGNASDAARTQVLLLTHRPEEISDGFKTVTFIDDGKLLNGMVRTEERLGRTGEEIVQLLVPDDKSDDVRREEVLGYSVVIPSDIEVKEYWEHGGAEHFRNQDILVKSCGLKVTRDNVTLLSRVDWTVKQGERWHLAGMNGSGKSTLSRLILRTSMKGVDIIESKPHVQDSDAIISDGSLFVTPSMASNTRLSRDGVSFVSTELHLHATHNWGSRTVGEILLSGASFLFYADKNHHEQAVTGSSIVDLDVAMTVARWFGLLDSSNNERQNDDLFLHRQFSTLSQGEQKLLLQCSAIAQRPLLLILDEPCQGLDLWNRGRLLGVIERICRVTSMSLIYITHHEEELIPSIGHKLLLDEGGNVTYCGLR
jgi:molybdate transport system ATP-binding protein